MGISENPKEWVNQQESLLHPSATSSWSFLCPPPSSWHFIAAISCKPNWTNNSKARFPPQQSNVWCFVSIKNPFLTKYSRVGLHPNHPLVFSKSNPKTISKVIWFTPHQLIDNRQSMQIYGSSDINPYQNSRSKVSDKHKTKTEIRDHDGVYKASPSYDGQDSGLVANQKGCAWNQQCWAEPCWGENEH